MKRSFLGLSACLLLASLGGCSKAPVARVDNPVTLVDQRLTASSFDATVRTLSSLGFTLDRQDRRHGVVTTKPLVAASIFEPWQPDGVAFDDELRSTVSYQRRIVRVNIEPVVVEAGDTGGPLAQPYKISVVARIQQFDRPPRNLHTAAVAGLRFRGNITQKPDELFVERGFVRAAWREAGRDEALEQKILRLILNPQVAPKKPGAEPDKEAAKASPLAPSDAPAPLPTPTEGPVDAPAAPKSATPAAPVESSAPPA